MIITGAKYLISSPTFDECPPPDRPEYAFIGRSNVGKSSLINMLCRNEKLARTSASPGKTQMINHFLIESKTHKESPTPDSWYLVDLPGYGYAKVSQTSRRRWEQMIENYLRKRKNLIAVFVLIDSRHTPQKLDIQFIENLTAWNIPFTLIFTKSDKEKQSVVSRNVKLFLDTLRNKMQFLPRHIITSAGKQTGREKVLEVIEEKNNDLKEK